MSGVMSGEKEHINDPRTISDFALCPTDLVLVICDWILALLGLGLHRGLKRTCKNNRWRNWLIGLSQIRHIPRVISHAHKRALHSECSRPTPHCGRLDQVQIILSTTPFGTPELTCVSLFLMFHLFKGLSHLQMVTLAT
jgi:hypothetical protein